MRQTPLFLHVLKCSFYCFLILCCAGCGLSPKIERLAEDSVILAFGNSLTAGTGALKEESYPAVLEQFVGCTVINAGVSGETSAEGFVRLPSLLEEFKPDLVILCHGGNDLLQQINEEQTIRNLKTMIEYAQNAGADVILIGVPKPGFRLKPPPFYGEIARQFKIPYDGKTLGQILSKPALRSDYVHPNAEGYKELAASIAILIGKSQP
jgi:lysophospholipase L1-like esterase